MKVSPMKAIALLALAATAAAFDGSGTFTTDGELSAHLDGTAPIGAAPGSPTLGVCDAAVVTSKAELDALASCHTIRGHLVIEGTSDITNVNVLSNLKEIDVSAGGSQYGGCTYGLIIRANTALLVGSLQVGAVGYQTMSARTSSSYYLVPLRCGFGHRHWRS